MKREITEREEKKEKTTNKWCTIQLFNTESDMSSDWCLLADSLQFIYWA